MRKRRSSGGIIMGSEAGTGYNVQKAQGKGYNEVSSWNGL